MGQEDVMTAAAIYGKSRSAKFPVLMFLIGFLKIFCFLKYFTYVP